MQIICLRGCRRCLKNEFKLVSCGIIHNILYKVDIQITTVNLMTVLLILI